MTLAGTIAATVMINSLLAVALAGTAARAVAVRGNQVAVEAEMALTAAEAVAVTSLADTGLVAGQIGPYPLNHVGFQRQWTGTARVYATANDTIWHMSLAVVGRDHAGRIESARSATLLLRGATADTAFVMEIR